LVSASTAVSYAVQAQASGAIAWAASVAAGDDEQAAADAASEARNIAREREQGQKWYDALMSGLVESLAIDQGDLVPGENEDGDTTVVGLWPKDTSDHKDWAEALGNQSYFMGVNSLMWSYHRAGTPLSLVTHGLGAGAAIEAGKGYGWESGEFHGAVGSSAIGLFNSMLPGNTGIPFDAFLIKEGVTEGSHIDCVYEKVGEVLTDGFDSVFGGLFK
jgi:hypothetical protein